MLQQHQTYNIIRLNIIYIIFYIYINIILFYTIIFSKLTNYWKKVCACSSTGTEIGIFDSNLAVVMLGILIKTTKCYGMYQSFN